MEHSPCEILCACYKLDQEKLFSNVKRAKNLKMKSRLNIPMFFFDKPVLYQVKKKLIERRLSNWVEKPQHGAFARQLKQISAPVKKSFGWMSSCFLDPFSETCIMAAQEMALFTKYREKNILHVSNDATCRICKNKN